MEREGYWMSTAPTKSRLTLERASRVDRLDVLLAAIFVTALALVGSLLVLAGPLGHLLPRGHYRFFASEMHEIYHKPTQLMRYLFGVAFALGLGLIVACVPVPSWLTATPARRIAIRVAGICGLIAIAGIAVWGWRGQFYHTEPDPPTAHLGNGDLIVGVAIAAALVLLAWLRPRWLEPRPFRARRPQSWSWFAVAALLTVCWLLPSVFLARDLASAGLSVTYHLKFTFDEFVAIVDGRTPLVNMAEAYASLLPFVVWPVLHLGGPKVGTFTVAMCCLTALALLSVERTLALVTRNERLALALYVPFLASSLFFIIRGSELFNWASYYGVFPMRYFGPYVLLWLCTRHLRGLRPRSSLIVFTCAGLVALNNLEFGLPALLAAFVAILTGSERGAAGIVHTIRDLVAGLIAALVVVSILTLLFAGQLPRLSLLSLYPRIFGEGGFSLLPTPLDGLYLVVDMTFAAAVLVAAVRYRSRSSDKTYTSALVYSGILGLGASNYYFGRTHPGGLVALFSIWALSVALLAVLALRTFAANRGRLHPSLLLLMGCAVISLGLVSTAIAQFPNPRTQIDRLRSSAPPLPEFDVSAAGAFLRRTTHPGESVLLIDNLGHQIAFHAGVHDVSLISGWEMLLTYEELAEALAALRKAGGSRVYTAAAVYPEITATLAARGFIPTLDAASGVTEWKRRPAGLR
jgi:hypothetical protein